MDTVSLSVDKDVARAAWRQYQKDRVYSKPEDWEIARIYQFIAQGRTVIRALASIVAAGLNADGYPKLAIARADASTVRFRAYSGSGLYSHNDEWPRQNSHPSRHIRVEWPGLDHRHSWRCAVLPPIPLYLRPKRALASYHVLWEAEWTPVPPGDPYLIKRIGQSDAWLVVGAWDLTEVEKAVLATRLGRRS